MTIRVVRDVTEATFREQVVDASRERPVVVDFWAPWCGPCRAVEPALERLSETTGGVDFVKLDIDRHLAVPSRYGVLSLPTVMLFAGGEVKATVVGARPRRHFERAFAEWLPT